MDWFLEIKYVVVKIGIVEVFIDLMVVEDVDVMIVMKFFKEWIFVLSWVEMVEKMKEVF